MKIRSPLSTEEHAALAAVRASFAPTFHAADHGTHDERTRRISAVAEAMDADLTGVRQDFAARRAALSTPTRSDAPAR